MFLTAENVYHYLRDAGLATPQDVANDDFAVVEVGRRNRNFRIVRPQAGSLFVKQVPMVHAETVGAFLREAACAQLAASAADGSPLAGMTPTLRRYDPQRHILVYEAIEPACTLADAAAQALTPSIPHAEALGRLLARIHMETATPGALRDIGSALPGQPPWVLHIAEGAEQVMPNLSIGGRQVVDRLRAHAELRQGLALLAATWSRVCLIHGDIKWDNVLLADAVDGADVRLTDWELADIGEPLWDVACGLVGWLQYWLLNLRADVLQAMPAAAAVQAPVALVQVHAPSAAFWRAYASAPLPDWSGQSDAYVRLGQLCGARLCGLAFELLPAAPAITPHAALALELARYFFVAPLAALHDLAGIGPLRSGSL